MVDNYLTVLEESLRKKHLVLDEILSVNKKQADLLKGAEPDWEIFDGCVDQKTRCIEQLNKLDEGFELLYQRIAEELKVNKAQYTQQIAQLQELIRGVMDKSMEIQAMEARNKEAVEQHFRRERTKLGAGRKSAKAAYNYYRSASGTAAAPPQFVDKKK